MVEVKVHKKYKVDAIVKLQSGFENTRSFLFADYRGLTVEQITELRDTLRGVGATFHVVKNNFSKIAFSRMNHKDVASFFVGPTAIAYCGDEAGPVAKILLKLAKDMPIEIKGGLVDGNTCDATDVQALSKLPMKIELLQMLMGTMKAPLNNVAYVLNGITTKLVRTLDAVLDQKNREN